MWRSPPAKGMVTVRSGKGDRYRKVPLNSACRSVLENWLDARSGLCDLKGIVADALWLSRLGTRLSVRAVGHVIERIAADTGLEGLSSHVLRHTFVTNLVRSGADVVADCRTRRASPPGHDPTLQPPVRNRPIRRCRIDTDRPVRRWDRNRLCRPRSSPNRNCER